MQSFNLVGLCLKEMSKCGILKFRGKGCSYCVVSLIIGNDFCQENNLNAKLMVKYITNLVILLSHVAIDSKDGNYLLLFCNSIEHFC